LSKAIRELLLRKADSEPLTLFLKHATDATIEQLVLESLKKMASYSGKRGTRYNAAVRDFLDSAVAETSAGEPSPMEGLRDAMGHHVSKYAAARASGNQDLAEQHAKQFTKLGHLGSKLDATAKTIAHFEPDHPADYRASMLDSAKFEAPDLQAWQSTSPAHFQDANKSSGVDITGWRAHDKQTGVRTKGKEGHPDKMSFGWYANDPHPTHRDTAGHKARGHDRGYPFEQVKVNDKHIPIGASESSGQYEAHPFDSHPIVSHYDHSPEEHAANADTYKNKLSTFHAGSKGLELATKAPELTAAGNGAKPGLIVHPKIPKGGE
jgi:hypothetical protein